MPKRSMRISWLSSRAKGTRGVGGPRTWAAYNTFLRRPSVARAGVTRRVFAAPGLEGKFTCAEASSYGYVAHGRSALHQFRVRAVPVVLCGPSLGRLKTLSTAGTEGSPRNPPPDTKAATYWRPSRPR